MTQQIPDSNPNVPPEPSNPNPNPAPPEYHDWREQRRAERMARREAHWQRRAGRPYGWFLGFLLVVLGVILLFESLGYETFVNWWALLILIPAYWGYVGSWNSYQENGKITRGVIFSLSFAILLTILTGILLFNLALGQYWPILLIVAGLVLLVSAFFPRR